MRTLLIVTALLEAVVGFVLAAAPSVLASILFGAPLDAPSASTLGRLAGIALLTMGLFCWLARNNRQGSASAAPVVAMLFYNVAAVTLLLYARLGLGLSGIGLWPGVAGHAALALWCIACLRIA
jgi:hypothetical protein